MYSLFSLSGAVSHVFEQPGVFYYSDQSYEAVASYLGVVIVLAKPKQHFVEVIQTGMQPGNQINKSDHLCWV